MKKTILLSIMASFSLLDAQETIFEENFEDGFPGKFTQDFIDQETTWIDFGISAIGVDSPLKGKNSAVFFNGLATRPVSTSLSTQPIDLSKGNIVLEFLYLQKKKENGTDNTLSVELLDEKGKWQKLLTLNANKNDGQEKIQIPLTDYSKNSKSVIRFVSTQYKTDSANPIVLDDVTIFKAKNDVQKSLSYKKDILYPNPTKNVFQIMADTDSFNCEVFDAKGDRVIKLEKISKNTYIDLSKQLPGVYYVKIYTDKQVTTHKLIKN
ncbi:T9SS type A sorting domain-containing protein [Chryseobacterium gregarium]|uniref:T9SS type A sorting domain-containing protein n=1 Tax=Chryseobacterium gregarium TaxID=456299 RepID=UPI00040F3CC0|nr:T9SS type A sorting domain-containing protein [Chryseobacterium gregarium]